MKTILLIYLLVAAVLGFMFEYITNNEEMRNELIEELSKEVYLAKFLDLNHPFVHFTFFIAVLLWPLLIIASIINHYKNDD